MAFEEFSKKLFKYFSSTIYSTSFVPLFSVLAVISCLNLNEAISRGKLMIIPALSIAGSSL